MNDTDIFNFQLLIFNSHGPYGIKKALPGRQGGRFFLICRFLAGFGTLLSQVAGLHRAGPSATLDKAMKLCLYFTRFFPFVKDNFGARTGFRPGSGRTQNSRVLGASVKEEKVAVPFLK